MKEYVKDLWEGNRLYRIDELDDNTHDSTFDWKPFWDADKHSPTQTYNAGVYPESLLLMTRYRNLNFCLGLRDESGKILRYCYIIVEGENTDTGKFGDNHKFLVSNAFKELDNDDALRHMIKLLEGSLKTFDLQNGELERVNPISLGRFGVGGTTYMSNYAKTNDLTQFATLMGMDLPNAELILMVDCFENSNNAPAVIERNTQPYVLVIRSFGSGRFKWVNDSPHKKKWRHSISLPTVEHVLENKTLADLTQVKTRHKRRMNMKLQERI